MRRINQRARCQAISFSVQVKWHQQSTVSVYGCIRLTLAHLTSVSASECDAGGNSDINSNLMAEV